MVEIFPFKIIPVFLSLEYGVEDKRIGDPAKATKIERHFTADIGFGPREQFFGLIFQDEIPTVFELDHQHPFFYLPVNPTRIFRD